MLFTLLSVGLLLPLSLAADSVSIDLSSVLNNKATSSNGENDGTGMVGGATYPIEYLPTGQWVNEGVEFSFPDWAGSKWDNVRADSQSVELPSATEVASLHFVAVGEAPGGFLLGETKETIKLKYEDGSEGQVILDAKNWWGIHWVNKGPIRTPFHFEADGSKNWNATHLFHVELPTAIESKGRKMVSFQLPPPNERNCLHVFAASYIPSETTEGGVSLEARVKVSNVHSTRRWDTVDGQRGQVVEVTINNPFSPTRHADSSSWASHPISVSLHGSDIKTIRAGRLARLMPGDKITVEVLVIPSGTNPSFAKAEIKLSSEGVTWSAEAIAVEGSDVVVDWTKWTEAVDDLEQHSTPSWFSDAKFGIFIHWGLFSVPAWTDENKYAEWYNWWLHNEGTEGGTYKHHLETYGADFVYDDFIPMFTGADFDAKEWIDVFEGAGAKYFVLTTKHHDGFALFDTGSSSDRSSVKLGPKRDFVKELMEAAEGRDIKKGTYFSMPEWFNPTYEPHGKVTFPGGLAKNPYRPSESEPYTGLVPVEDYIEDIQLAQMRILAKEYGTDLMWCDIGLANHSSAFASEWFAETARQDRQVAIDNRCGIGGDFDSPEMTKFSSAQSRKWETCAGIDPHSFGYNAMTPAEDYRTATDIIHTLVDITAKGGNFLLNIGPTGTGEIPEVMTKPLLEAGKWLKINGRAIYGTVPFFILPELITDDLDIRFTRTQDAFYIISLKQPKHDFVLPAPLTILPGDTLRLIGSSRDYDLEWSWKDGSLHVETGSVLSAEDFGPAWVFEVVYQDSKQDSRTSIRDEL